MDITEVKNTLLNIIRLIGIKIKETVQLPYAKLYMAVSFMLIIFFMIITFPYGIFIEKQLQNLDGTIASKFNFSSLDFNFFGESKIDQVRMEFKGGNELTINEITYDGSTVSLLPSLILKNNLNISGSAGFSGVKYVTEDKTITGIINSDFDIYINRSPSSLKEGSISFIMKNVNVKMKDIELPESMGSLVLNIPKLRFPAINLNFEISEKKILIKNGIFSGSDLKGKINGTINRSRLLRNSGLDLKLSINKNSAILSNYDMILSKLVKNNTITLLIKGTINNPRVEFKK